MTLDINSNGSYFYNGKPRKNNNEEESDADEHKNKDEDKESQSKKKSYEKKKADVSSLDLMGMQNALMIHKESIVHPSGSVDNKKMFNYNENSDGNIKPVHSSSLEKSSHSDLHVPDNVCPSHQSFSTNNESESSVSNNIHSENKNATQISGNVKSVSNDLMTHSDIHSKLNNSVNVSNINVNYEELGIIQNDDGTFSMKNNPFGRFTKETIEDYINKYIYPSSPDTWVNGYSQIYTIKNQKFFLMKVTLTNGTRAFRGTIIENETLCTIYFAVNEKGLPDENKVLMRR